MQYIIAVNKLKIYIQLNENSLSFLSCCGRMDTKKKPVWVSSFATVKRHASVARLG